MTSGSIIVSLQRKSFEHEHELRALVFKMVELDKQGEIKKISTIDNPMWEDGGYISVNLDTLIEIIHVSPVAPDWLFDVVQSVMKLYGLGKGVFKSDLDSAPFY